MSFDTRPAQPRVYLARDMCDKSCMSTRELIDKEVAALPESLQREVYDFVRFLRLKSEDESFNGLLLSESALARDWDTPEEDAAWASL
jgi:hypothetical protein